MERIPMELLILLVERSGELVTREEIMAKFWGEAFLDTDNAVNTAVRKIRQALEDSPELPRFVQTVSGKGYRFIAPVNKPVVAEQQQPSAGSGLVATGLDAKPGTRLSRLWTIADALKLSKSRDVEYGAALALALSGDSSRSQALMEDLARRFPEDTRLQLTYGPTLRALLALNHNKPAAIGRVVRNGRRPMDRAPFSEWASHRIVAPGRWHQSRHSSRILPCSISPQQHRAKEECALENREVAI